MNARQSPHEHSDAGRGRLWDLPWNLLVVAGPTASGKTALGVELAARFAGEIISVDSRQVFRGMDLGTGKDLHEYGSVPYHLIDILDPGQEFSVYAFQRRFFAAFDEIRYRGRLPVAVGGTGLYLEAVLKGYRLTEVPENPALRQEVAALSLEDLTARLRNANPRLHNTTDLLERERLVRALEIALHEPAPEPEPAPDIRPFIIGIRWERSLLRQRITARLKARLEQGMIGEVEHLLANGVPPETLEYYGLEYRYIAAHLRGTFNRNDLFQKLNSAIHDFAKRQETWFRRMERNGTTIHWVEGAGEPMAEALELLDRARQNAGGGDASPHPAEGER
ncbi:MAG TPA: tRNA (adenosine(37)-N6)-dimethylallyltransferase MiaA [Geobacteraceae bacterium]